jgi:hypothetical protein
MIVPIDHTIHDVTITRHSMCVELADGRQLCAPLEWFPLLSAAKPAQREEFVIAEDGLSVAWPTLGETVSADYLLARRQSVAKRDD